MIIYKTTNLINNKIYVGKYEGNRESYLGSGKILRYAFEKYGRQNFKRETLEVCDNRNTLNERERYWIKELNSQYPNGYNLSEGGDWGDVLTNHPYRLEIIKKRANNLRKYLQTPEAKEKRSEASKKMWEDPAYVNKQITVQKIAQNNPQTKLNKSINGKKAQNTPEIKERKSNDLKERWKNDPEYAKKALNALRNRYQNAPVLKCPHCGSERKNKVNFNKWHNQKCKSKIASDNDVIEAKC